MAITRVVTHAEVAALSDGAVLQVEEGAELTPLAAERAQARRITIQRGGPAAGTAEAQRAAITQATQQVLAKLQDRLGGALSSVSPDLESELKNRIAQEVLQSLGDPVGGDPAGKEVGLPPAADYCAAYLHDEKQHARRRAVLTATGKNQKGVVAHLATLIAEHGGDILDISQTLVGGYFTMLLIVDISDLTTPFSGLKQALADAAQSRGMQAILMHEDIVSSMHRV